nr:prepilin-type N-terminal cleavage/methylation domain-containing protein [uncultured Blautia sp.]
MFKLLNKKKNNKGFTLVELVIVVAILAILVGILAPQYTKYVEKSRKSADASNLEEMVKAVQVYEADTDSAASLTAGDYTITMTTGGPTAVTDNANFKAALSEYVPDYATKKLKSKKWGETGIKATITVADDGKVTVAYEPKALSDYIGVAEKK